MSAYLRSLIKIRTQGQGRLKNLSHKQQAGGDLEFGFSKCMHMRDECGGLPAVLLRRQGQGISRASWLATLAVLASYVSNLDLMPQ